MLTNTWARSLWWSKVHTHLSPYTVFIPYFGIARSKLFLLQMVLELNWLFQICSREGEHWGNQFCFLPFPIFLLSRIWSGGRKGGWILHTNCKTDVFVIQGHHASSFPHYISKYQGCQILQKAVFHHGSISVWHICIQNLNNTRIYHPLVCLKCV